MTAVAPDQSLRRFIGYDTRPALSAVQADLTPAGTALADAVALAVAQHEARLLHAVTAAGRAVHSQCLRQIQTRHSGP